jgi:hypothetical protein
MRLRVAYDEPSQLIADHDSQMVKGGLLVRGDPPSGIALFENVELELQGPFPPLEEGLVVTGQVVQIISGVGVAVVFDPKAVASAIAMVREAQARPSPARPTGGSETAAKIQLALHGNKDERFRILRDANRLLHPYVLKNPGLGLDEVVAMARMTTLAPEVLNTIAERKEWAQRPDIAIALVRNPKTPTPTAVRLLDYVSASDLRQLAKDSKTRPAVQQAARKKVLGA